MLHQNTIGSAFGCKVDIIEKLHVYFSYYLLCIVETILMLHFTAIGQTVISDFISSFYMFYFLLIIVIYTCRGCYLILVVSPACVQQWQHIGITIRRLASSGVVVVWRRRRHKKISVTFFSGTIQASFPIFGTDHQYGELYRVMQFRICRMSTSCLTELRIFFI